MSPELILQLVNAIGDPVAISAHLAANGIDMSAATIEAIMRSFGLL